MSFRKAFIGEFFIRTHRNFFNSISPTADDFFSRILAMHSSGSVPTLAYEYRTLELKEISKGNSSWELLFVLVDPTAPDPSLRDRSSGAISAQRRGHSQDPIFSCHMVVDASSQYDALKKYPMAIENRALISKSNAINLLNTAAKAGMLSVKSHVAPSGKISQKDFIPRVSMIAPVSHTIRGALERGGSLQGVSIVYEKTVSQTHGDSNYPVIEERDIRLKVQNRPSGDQATGIVRKICNSVIPDSPSKIKVMIEDASGIKKTVPISEFDNDILSRAFIHQVDLTGIHQPEVQCEESVNAQVAAALLKAAQRG